MATSITLAASGVATSGVGDIKKKTTGYSKGCNLVVTVTAISANTNLSGYLQTSDNGTYFTDTCSITGIVTGDVTSTIKSFAARYEGSIPAFVRIRWVRTGDTVTALAKLIFDD